MEEYLPSGNNGIMQDGTMKEPGLLNLIQYLTALFWTPEQVRDDEAINKTRHAELVSASHTCHAEFISASDGAVIGNQYSVNIRRLTD